MTAIERKQKIGQLMIVGLPGTRLTPEWRDRLCDLRPAGAILLRRNIESTAQLAELTSGLGELAREHGFSPLLIATDEEGGFLSPVLGLTEPAPAAMALGTVGSETLAYETAKVVGFHLRAAGVNLNLAPCLDVNDEPRNPVIGPRSFGTDPSVVARLGVQTLRGLKAGGVLTTAKHFPGHGSTTLDSHKALPVDHRGLATLHSRSLIPFDAAIDAGVDLVMSAHVCYPSVTGDEREPATLSRQLLGNLLRGEMDFRGAVVTDALEMAAVRRLAPPGEVALRALQAGADLLLFTLGDSMPWEVRDVLVNAVRDGSVSEERMDLSLNRVNALKSAIPEPSAPGETGVFAEVRRKGIRVLSDPLGLIPLHLGATDDLGVLVPDPSLPEGSIDCVQLERVLNQKHGLVRVVKARPDEETDLKNLASCRWILVFVLSRGPLDPWQENLVRKAGELVSDVILVAAFNPFVLPELEKPHARVATYDFSPPAMSALVERLFGKP